MIVVSHLDPLIVMNTLSTQQNQYLDYSDLLARCNPFDCDANKNAVVMVAGTDAAVPGAILLKIGLLAVAIEIA